MFKALLASLAIFSNLFCNVTRIDSLLEIPKQPAQTLYLFDLDDTIFDFQYMLGSKPWRIYIMDKNPVLHELVDDLIFETCPYATMEAETRSYIESLKKEHDVFALTARKECPVTFKQLDDLNISFQTNNPLYPSIKNHPSNIQGVFSTNHELKGPYLAKVLAEAETHPTKIIFVDDRIVQVESVSQSLTELGIDHDCYWYTKYEEKLTNFNPLIASIQLYYLWFGNIVLSDDQAATIATQCPYKTAEDYQQAVLNLKDAHIRVKRSPSEGGDSMRAKRAARQRP